LKARKEAISTASHVKKFGLILSTLGRQGNLKVLKVCWLLHEHVWNYQMRFSWN